VEAKLKRLKDVKNREEVVKKKKETTKDMVA
jgi:hypothetical protein